MNKERKNFILYTLIFLMVVLIAYMLLKTDGGGDYKKEVNERQKAIETEVLPN